MTNSLIEAFVVFCICGMVYTALEVSYHALFEEEEEEDHHVDL